MIKQLKKQRLKILKLYLKILYNISTKIAEIEIKLINEIYKRKKELQEK